MQAPEERQTDIKEAHTQRDLLRRLPATGRTRLQLRPLEDRALLEVRERTEQEVLRRWG